MTTPATPLSFGDVLRISAVKRLFIAQIVSVFGDFLALFAVLAHVTFNLHGTATQVSMVMVSFLLPLAIISPIAGVYVDKWNVKATMVGSDLIRAVLILGLVFVHDIRAIYVIFFIMASVSAFFIPAQSVVVRTITPAAGLMAVNGLMSQAMQGSQIIAPSISGALVQLIGANACFAIDTVSFLFSAAMLMTIPIHRETSQHAAASSVFSSMRTGFQFIFSHQTVSFVILSMTAGMFAVRCFGALLSVYVRDVLVSTSATFGILNTLIGVGMIVGTQSLTRFAKHIEKRLMVIYGLAVMAVAVLITATFGTIATAAAGMLGIGIGVVFILITAQTLLQQETPKELQGRVSSAWMSLMAWAQVTAMFLAGPVAEKAGIRNLYFASAALLFAIAFTGWSKLGAQTATEV